MILKKWEDLPDKMKNDKVKKYYNILEKQRKSLLLKRVFDVLTSLTLLFILFPVFLIISMAIKIETQGPIIFKQVRVTQYGKKFKIFKFRTMVSNAESIGAQLTAEEDERITKVGSAIRDARLDELPQLFNIFMGDMTFVGTRPEVPKYVKQYTDEMLATLLLPAGVTSEASIKYKDESQLLMSSSDIDQTYVDSILPGKMVYNLEMIEDFSFYNDIQVIFKTIRVVLVGRN